MKPKHLHLDAVKAGALAFLRSYPEPALGPAQGLRPPATHTINWADDYGRGVELARVALIRACKGLPRDSERQGDATLASLAHREALGEEPATPAELEEMSGAQREAWDALLVLLDNLFRTGDPDTSADADAEERAEEEELA